MRLFLVVLFSLQTMQSAPLLENGFVRIFRNSAPCAAAAPSCGDRVLVALGSIELDGQHMKRGDVKVFTAGQRYSAPVRGEYLEVTIKPNHPKVNPPAAGTPPPPGNKVLYEGNNFIVFEEKMEPGELSSRHSHNQRVAIFLNDTQVQQWTDGKSETRELIPDTVTFRPAVIHISKDAGSTPIRNLLIEFKP